MALKLYLAVCFGGDGKENTHLLVRASDLIEAARIADEHLTMMPLPFSEPSCDRITELGADGASNHEPGVITGPLIGLGGISNGYRTWMREDGLCDDWRDVKEVFGE